MKKLCFSIVVLFTTIISFAQSNYDQKKHLIHNFILIPAMIFAVPAANPVQNTGKTVQIIRSIARWIQPIIVLAVMWKFITPITARII